MHHTGAKTNKQNGGATHDANISVGNAVFDGFLFDNETKTLKKIDPKNKDRFADDFNEAYGGKNGLNVKDGNLYLNDDLLIGAEQSRIKTLILPALKKLSNGSLISVLTLMHFEATSLIKIGNECFKNAPALVCLKVPALKVIGNICFIDVKALTHFIAPSLIKMGHCCLFHASSLIDFKAISLKEMGDKCLFYAPRLPHFEAASLIKVGRECFSNLPSLTHFVALSLTKMGRGSLSHVPLLKHYEVKSRRLAHMIRNKKIGMGSTKILAL